MASTASVIPGNFIELTPVHETAAATAPHQQRVVHVPENNGLAEFTSDLMSFRTPQHLREALQNIDTVTREHKVAVRNSIGLGLTALAGAFAAAPSLLTAIQTCPSGTEKSDKGACFSNGFAVAGALIGLVGLGYTVWGAVLGRTHHYEQIKQLDYELKRRYQPDAANGSQVTIGPDSVMQRHNANKIASRFLALAPAEKEQLLSDLFEEYVHIRTTPQGP